MNASLNVGVIGVGNMGGAMAARLLSLGHRVVVRDIRPEAEAALARPGAQVAPSPAAVAKIADFIVIAVVDAAQNEAVLFDETQAVVAGLMRHHVVLLTSTIAPADAASLAQRIAATGAAVLDAPVSGGPQRARDGSMSMMIGATDADVARAQPLLAALSSAVFRVGEKPGQGAAMKLVNNMLAAVNLVAAGEACALAARAGLDLAAVSKVVNGSSGQSWIFAERAARLLAGDAMPRAHVSLLAKDSALAAEFARELGLACDLGKVAAREFADALVAGLADADDSAMLRRR